MSLSLGDVIARASAPFSPPRGAARTANHHSCSFTQTET